MKYTQTTPCKECPFLLSMKKGFSIKRLKEFASNSFPCHKSAEIIEGEGGGEYHAKKESVHCAGALIFCEKRGQPNQMMRIAERLGMYDRTKLNMSAKIR